MGENSLACSQIPIKLPRKIGFDVGDGDGAVNGDQDIITKRVNKPIGEIGWQLCVGFDVWHLNFSRRGLVSKGRR